MLTHPMANNSHFVLGSYDDFNVVRMNEQHTAITNSEPYCSPKCMWTNYTREARRLAGEKTHFWKGEENASSANKT